MMDVTQITESLLRAVDEVNQGLPPNKKVPREPNAVLFGTKAEVDSLVLINLVILAERNIESDFGRTISLADERALLEEKSPFRSISSMATYVAKLLKEESN